MKRITVRLYRQHDMDLISLFMNEDFKFEEEMKKSAVAMFNNVPYTVNVPEYHSERMYLKRTYMAQINLNKEDEPVLEKIQEIRRGQICSFFKASMRACLSAFPYGAYFGGDGFTMSKAEETKLVNEERQEQYEKDKKAEKQPETETKDKVAEVKKKDAEKDKKEKKVKKEVQPVVIEEKTIPEPIPFEDLPLPEPEEDTTGSSADDDDDMDLFNSIHAVASGIR